MGSRQVRPRGTRDKMTDQALPIGATVGMTPMSWLLITVFYIIYYTLLAGFWLLCLFIFYQFIEDHQPRWQQDSGLIGKSPALGVRPGQDDSIIESSVIIFN